MTVGINVGETEEREPQSNLNRYSWCISNSEGGVESVRQTGAKGKE